MTLRKNQATETAWIAHPGLARRVSLVIRGALTQDTRSEARHANNAIDYYQREGRRLQARAVSRAVRTAGRWLWRRAEAAASGLRTRHQVRVAERELGRLDERLLKDIGITRNDIPAVARGLLQRAPGQRVAAGELTATRERARPTAPCNDAQVRDAA